MIEIVAAFLIGVILGAVALVAVALHYGKDENKEE